jgi:hypothetical protein
MIGKLIWVATIISIATYLFWPLMPKGCFYIGNSLFIFLLAIVIFTQNRKLFISFFLLCIAANNLLDELFFNPKELGVNEIVFALTIPIIYYARKNNRLRTLRFFN